MISLNEFLKKSINLDAHVHAFDNDYVLDDIAGIVFPDIRPSINSVEKFEEAYERFPMRKRCVLACGYTPTQCLEIYNRYKDYMCGFGEVIIYKKSLLGRDDIDNGWLYYKDVLDFADANHLPFLYHYDIFDAERYKDEMVCLLSKYPNVRFVHAHCGITKPSSPISDVRQDYSCVFSVERLLAKTFENYFLDFSWESNKIYDVSSFIKSLPKHKWVIGSDTSARYSKLHHTKYLELKGDFNNLFEFHKQNNKNIKRIYRCDD